MRPRFEELDWRDTSLGEICLRRRVEPTLGVDVYEVKLGEEYLMSSLFTVAETELARHGLAAVGNRPVDVLVGGLGLGYTAAAVLEDARVRSLTVVEAIEAVLDWHRSGLIPDTAGLHADSRTRLLHGDFFALVAGEAGFGPEVPKRYDAILVDIDHTPRHVLHQSHASFYTPEGLTGLKRHLQPGGIFGLWSDDPPDPQFLDGLVRVFDSARAEVVAFPNPLTGGESSNTVYLARA